jgi:hypothetical protein
MTRRSFSAALLGAFARLSAQVEVWPITNKHDHVQGLEVSDRWFWVSAVDRRSKTGWVWRIDRLTLQTVAERNITRGALYHPSGFQVAGNSLWIAIAEYRPNSQSAVLELDPMTLAERRSFLVRDHIGAVASDGRDFVLGANWDARRIYRWTVGGTQLQVATNPSFLAIQDMKWVGDTLYAGGVGIGPNKGQCLLQQMHPLTLSVLKGSALKGDLCYTREGMALSGGRFFFLPEDEPNSRVYALGAPR